MFRFNQNAPAPAGDRKYRSFLGRMTPVALLVVALAITAPSSAQSGPPAGAGDASILTVDRFVPHVSTVPANLGAPVNLFLREKIQGPARSDKPVVLMIHGHGAPSVEAFDLPFENYSWMTHLATAGFDVFAMDFTGYGASPRPMMADPCNTSLAEQTSLLIPNPLPHPCAPSYPFRLQTSQSEWDEIDTVVDFIRQLRLVDKVSLIAWSRGGSRAGGYIARHPYKVEKLFLYSPTYDRLTPSNPPAVLPQPGVPMTVQRGDDFSGLDAQVKCENQFTPAIRPVLSSIRLAFDPLGRTWGQTGVRRSGVENTRWGWNAAFAHQIKVPTLIIRGLLDATVPEAAQRDLYADLGTEQKVFIRVECASHFLVWENQHEILYRASEQWLRNGRFAGHQSGFFLVDTEGNVVMQ
jgi:pimeloyl-ACP methyl ester carboxylesterase